MYHYKFEFILDPDEVKGSVTDTIHNIHASVRQTGIAFATQSQRLESGKYQMSLALRVSGLTEDKIFAAWNQVRPAFCHKQGIVTSLVRI